MEAIEVKLVDLCKWGQKKKQLKPKSREQSFHNNNKKRPRNTKWPTAKPNTAATMCQCGVIRRREKIETHQKKSRKMNKMKRRSRRSRRSRKMPWAIFFYSLITRQIFHRLIFDTIQLNSIDWNWIGDVKIELFNWFFTNGSPGADENYSLGVAGRYSKIVGAQGAEVCVAEMNVRDLVACGLIRANRSISHRSSC